MQYKGTVGNTCVEHIELLFSWKVENFFSLSKKVDNYYESHVYHFLGHSFVLRLIPNGRNYYKSEGWIGLFLIQDDSCPPMEVECTLGILTAEGEIEQRKKFSNSFREKGRGLRVCNYLKRTELLSRREELAPSDAVTFTDTMKKNGPLEEKESSSDDNEDETEASEDEIEDSDGSDETGPLEKTGTTSEVAVQTSPEDIGSDGKDENRPLEKTATKEIAVQTTPEDVDSDGNDNSRPAEKTGTKEIAVQTTPEDVDSDRNDSSRPAEKTDFATFCQNIGEVKGKDCDVTLEVRGTKFRVHKLILEARTPVLAAMFSDNTAEAETAVVCVRDCHPEPFEVFLRFVYSGVAENLTIDNAADVYYVAKKYDLPRLKKECVRHMLANLTTGSVCRVIDMAHRHGEELLKERATEFLVENAREIFKTPVWRKFTEENSLAYDLYTRVHKNWKHY